MFTLEMILLGLALAIDAAVVSFAIGLVSNEIAPTEKVVRGVITASVFGLFQFLMLWLGSYGGFLFTFSGYGYLFSAIVAVVFFLIAAKFYHESVDESDRDLKWGFLSLIILAFATSVDALAAGISLGTLPHPHLSALEIGLITTLLCGIFYSMAHFFKNIPEKWLLRFASLIFFGLAANIVWDQFAKEML